MTYNTNEQSPFIDPLTARTAKDIERRVRALGSAGNHPPEDMARVYERAMRLWQATGRIVIAIPAGHVNRDTRRTRAKAASPQDGR